MGEGQGGGQGGGGQSTGQAIKFRRVTEARPNWSEQQRGEHGRFTPQIILDDGAEE
ncbi:MAG TPA: hypothetical protein VGR18_14090 [Rubrobacter sp.]|nr:hypothetical protein [Rubrobacter sp.]